MILKKPPSKIIEIDDSLGKEEGLFISISDSWDYAGLYIDRAMAKIIIMHLKKVFKI